MKIPISQEVEIQPATVLLDQDGDPWILLPDNTLLHLHGVITNGGRMSADQSLRDYGPWTIWTPETTP